MSPLERIAHDIICIVKYGSPGGSATSGEIARVTKYLSRVGKLPELEIKTPPVPVLINAPLPTIKINIKVPGAT